MFNWNLQLLVNVGGTVSKEQKRNTKIALEPENKDKGGKNQMHVIRKQLGKDECDGKLLLSLSMQSCAGHSPHKGDYF